MLSYAAARPAATSVYGVFDKLSNSVANNYLKSETHVGAARARQSHNIGC